MTPTFTVIIGSAGRNTLTETLESIARQKRVDGDRVIVCFDAFEKTEADLEPLHALVWKYGDWAIPCLHDAGYHFYGVEQLNAILTRGYVQSSHVITLGDDDVFVDGAYETLRPIVAADPLRPVFYKFLTPPTDPQGRPWRDILWDVPRLIRSRISGCCIAAPAPFVGPFDTKTQNPDGSPYVEHDFDWMVEIVTRSGREPLWLDEVLVLARPDAYQPAYGRATVKHKGLVRCWRCPHWRYLEDVSVLEPHCPKCKVVMQVSELLGQSA